MGITMNNYSELLWCDVGTLLGFAGFSGEWVFFFGFALFC